MAGRQEGHSVATSPQQDLDGWQRRFSPFIADVDVDSSAQDIVDPLADQEGPLLVRTPLDVFYATKK